jgi:cold shock CspA family protein
MQGEVKFYLVMDGFGFINGEDGQEYFVHKTQLLGRKLIKGERVAFEVGKFKNRTVAVKISPIDAPEVSGASNDRN